MLSRVSLSTGNVIGAMVCFNFKHWLQCVHRSVFIFQVHTKEDGGIITLPIHLPSSWLKVLLADHVFLLAGGVDKNLGDQLEAFWTCYRSYQGGHAAFQKSKEELRATIPILVHGDEGRHVKKSNWMVCTIETVLGLDVDKKLRKGPCLCHLDGALSRFGDTGAGQLGDENFSRATALAGEQHVNDAGQEFLSKYLCFSMSSLQYKKDRTLLTKAFQKIADDLTSLYNEGIQVQGQRYYCATLGVKGDLKFHHQIGNLSRSYYNTGTRQDIPMCSLCMAGHPAVTFEDVTDDAVWLSTMYTQKPWLHAPALATIPFEPGCEEGIFRLDLFHVWKCGLGRDLTGSTLILMCQLGYLDFEPGDACNLPARLNRAHSLFRLWAQASHRSPALHSFSKQLLNYKNEQSFAWFNVKGSDTTLLTHWLLFQMKTWSRTASRHPRFESAVVETLESAKTVFEVLHSHPLWMTRTCGQRVQYHLTVMVRGYKVLAQEAMNLGVVGFGLKPKLHACDHIVKDMRRQLLSNACKIFNPLAFSCEANESVVGHVSRIARRVNTRTCSVRVMERVRIKVKSLIGQFKAKLRTRHHQKIRPQPA